MEITINNTACIINIGRYFGHNPKIQLYDKEDGCPYATASVNVPGLATNEVCIKDYSENEGMYTALLAKGIITPAHRNIKTGFVSCPVCYLEVQNLLTTL